MAFILPVLLLPTLGVVSAATAVQRGEGGDSVELRRLPVSAGSSAPTGSQDWTPQTNAMGSSNRTSWGSLMVLDVMEDEMRNISGANGSLLDNGTIIGAGDKEGMLLSSNDLQLISIVGTAFVLGLIILATIVGNVFVIAAILLERHLQNVANYLILSLAVADLLVACLVMPLGAVYEVSQEWSLGPELCDMWTSSDVLCCTASILHLVAIAVDRYWAVTDIDYIHHRNPRRIGTMILVVWTVAFLVSIAPLLGWKDPEWEKRVKKDNNCMVSQDVGYQIFATMSSFYLPLLVILFLYWRIFQTARKRIRRRAVGMKTAAAAAAMSAGMGTGVLCRPPPTVSETTAFTNVSSNNTSPEKTSVGNGLAPDPPTMDGISGVSPQPSSHHSHAKRKAKAAADSKRERKAAKTLAIITGAFVMCWLPFFIMALLMPLCSSCEFSPLMVSFFLWLGYFNSTLNPIIYTIFSPEFRQAFKRLLCGRRFNRSRHVGMRYMQ